VSAAPAFRHGEYQLCPQKEGGVSDKGMDRGKSGDNIWGQNWGHNYGYCSLYGTYERGITYREGFWGHN